MAGATTAVSGPARIVALIPAHNEEASIQLAISALHGQTWPPDRIVVIADNCSDGTAPLALPPGPR